MQTSTILRGFDDPVTDAQAAFRAALAAMAHPGSTRTVSAPQTAPAGLSVAMAALLLTLADNDTPVWLPEGVSEDITRYLRFHCGCPLVATPMAARFVAAPSGHVAPALNVCHPGDPAYPDRSASMLLEVDSLTDGPPMRLTGPGIKDEERLRVTGLPAGFWSDWNASHRRFPLGVDVFLVAGRQFCALPRTTRVQES